jgi:hypothetical protein
MKKCVYKSGWRSLWKLSQNSENLQNPEETQQNRRQQNLSWRQKSELTRDG